MSERDTIGARAGETLRGMGLLARGDRRGLAHFGRDPEAVLSALAPQFALIMVSALTVLARPTQEGGVRLLALYCAALLPVVLSQALARRWGKAGAWPHFAAAMLWSGWVSFFLLLALSAGLGLVVPGLLTRPGVMIGLALVVEAYDLWLRWFVARAALEISKTRAAVLVVAIALSIVALYGVLAALPPHFEMWRDMLSLSPPPQAGAQGTVNGSGS